MKDIYGEDYLLITRHDYDRLYDRIRDLEKQNQEMHNWICNQAKKATDLVGETIAITLKAR